MPKTKCPPENTLLDTWGRKNRKLEDKQCKECGIVFRPKASTSKYCSRKCSWANNGGHNKKIVSWWKNPKGYIEGRIWIDEDTYRNVKQHRYFMELHIGRPLHPLEDIHHINGIKDDNRIENLQIISHSEHWSLHR